MGPIIEEYIHKMAIKKRFINKMDIRGTPFWELSKYISIVYGVSEAISEDPNIKRIAYAGTIYALSGLGKKLLERKARDNEFGRTRDAIYNTRK